MLFFRTISLVAALAFATLSSAVPVEGAGLINSGDVFARDVSELALPVKRGRSITDYYNTCHENVQNIIVEIDAYVKVGDHGGVLDCLNRIAVEITILISGVQDCDSVEVDVHVFAQIVAGLLQIFVNISVVVVNLSVDIKTCIGVIGNHFVTLIQVTVKIVIGLQEVLPEYCGPFEHDLGLLGILHLFVGILL